MPTFARYALSGAVFVMIRKLPDGSARICIIGIFENFGLRQVRARICIISISGDGTLIPGTSKNPA